MAPQSPLGRGSHTASRSVLTQVGQFGGTQGYTRAREYQIRTGVAVRPRPQPSWAKLRTNDMVFLTELIDAGKLTPVIGRTYPLSEAPDAIRHVETGHARGKTLITV
jgi:NADPH:quinone reductase-like Zn-dependent oxidoreductase